MLRKKLGYIVLGTVIGSVLTLSTGAFAETTKLVSAYLGNHIRFEFNGEIKKPSEDKPAIIYKDSIYVPIRFIAEGTGMPINWNPQTQTVEIKTPEPQIIEKIVYKEIPKEDTSPNSDKDKNKKEEQKKYESYKTLPIEKTYSEMNITALSIIKNSSDTKIYFSIKNKDNAPLQLLQSETTILVDGITYDIKDMNSGYWDYSWYDDIPKNEEHEGYIIFKNIPEDTKGICIVLKVMKNDYSKEIIEVPFEIKIN